MYFQKITLAALASGLAWAQTPPDAPSFIPATANNLIVSFGNGDIVAGDLIPLTGTRSQPSISLPSAVNGTFTLIMVDPDARSADGTPRTVLHWLQPDLTTSTLPFVNTTPVLATYRFPQPPPENPTRAHRYIQLLFQQTSPVVLSGAFVNASSVRSPFDLAGFLTQSGLGGIVAANYFQTRNDSLVANATTTATVAATAVSSPVATGSATSTPTNVPAQTNTAHGLPIWGCEMLVVLGLLGFAVLL